MGRSLIFLTFSLLWGLESRAQTYSATYLPSNAPNNTEQGQFGTNKCGAGWNQTSECQNIYLNSVDDFCIFGPPESGAGNTIGFTERIEVAWCMKNGTGSRLIPVGHARSNDSHKASSYATNYLNKDGTVQGAHFVQTLDFVQITGVGDLTKMNVPADDGGGELDPHGADGNGNPIGGLVFSTAFGQLEQIHEWTNFVGATEFCFRACKPGPMATTYCAHIYDELGCMWNMPANYDSGVFENCQGDSGQPMGVEVNGGTTSTFSQGDPTTPSAHPIPSSSSCMTVSSIGNGVVVSGNSAVSGPGITSSSSTPASTTGPTSPSRTTSASSAGATNPTTTSRAVRAQLISYTVVCGGSMIAVIAAFVL